MDTPLAVRHNSGIYIIHPRGIHVALFLTGYLKFFQDFRTSNPKRSKRLYMSCPTLPTLYDKAIYGVGRYKGNKNYSFSHKFKESFIDRFT